MSAVRAALLAAEPGDQVDPRSPDTDAAIIARSLAEPQRFAGVFDRHYARIHAFAARRLGPGLADDVASETFLIAFDRRDRYDAAHPDAAPWLYRGTYTYRGQRSTVVRDATIDPSKSGNPTGSVERGDRTTLTRVATAVVDEPGTRP